MYFQKYRLWKIWLHHPLKSTVSEHSLTVSIWKRPRYLQNLHESAFMLFFIILSEFDSENVLPRIVWKIRGGC